MCSAVLAYGVTPDEPEVTPFRPPKPRPGPGGAGAEDKRRPVPAVLQPVPIWADPQLRGFPHSFGMSRLTGLQGCRQGRVVCAA